MEDVQIMALAAFGLVFAMMMGYRVRERIIQNPDSLVLHYQMLLLGLAISSLVWVDLWIVHGWATAWLVHLWVGLIPFTLVYSFELAADKEIGIWDVFWNWFLGGLFLVIPYINLLAIAGLCWAAIDTMRHRDKHLPARPRAVGGELLYGDRE